MLVAARIGLIYLLAGSAYIVLSGVLLENLADDPDVQHRLEVAKGLAFIVLTSVLLFWTIRRELKRRDRLEAKSRTYHEILQQLLTNMPTAVVLKDIEGRYVMANRAFLESVGEKERDVIGKKPADFFDEEHLAEFTEYEHQVIETGRTHFFQTRTRMPGKEARQVEVIKFPIFDGRGDVAYVGTINVDVTERVKAKEKIAQSEKRFREFAELAADVFWETDKEGRFTYFSRNALYEFNGVKTEDFIGWTSDDLADHLGADPDIVERHRRLMTKRKSFEDVRFVYRHPDFGERCMSLAGRPIRDAEGNFAGYRGVGRDITAQTEAEEKLRQSETLYRTILDHAPVMVTVRDKNERYLITNKQFRDHFGLGDGSYSVREIFDEDMASRFAERGKRVLAHGELVVAEERLQDSDGSERDILLKYFPIYDDDNAVSSVGAVSVDITEQRETERALRRSESQLRAIVSNSPLSANLKDMKGRYLLANQSFCDRIGLPEEKLIGKTVFDVFDEEDADRSAAIFDEVVARDETVTYEVEYLHPLKGNSVALVSTFPIHDDSGEIIQLGSVSVDITDRREAEKAVRVAEHRLRTVLDNAPVSVMLMDVDGRYQFVNQNFCSRLGATEDEIIGKKRKDIFPPEQVERGDRFDKEILAAGRPIEHEERMRLANGDFHEFLVTNFPIRNDDGEIVQIGAVSMDVTERREMERQLRQAQKMESVGQLTAGIAHDFNNLLTVIIGNSRMLADELRDREDLAAVAAMISKAGEQGSDLTERLLAFGRRQRLEPGVLEIGNIINGVADLLLRTLGEHIALDVEIEDGVDSVFADESQLETAILNLAVNARDAMPNGGRLRIEASSRTVGSVKDQSVLPDLAPGDYIAISLEDTGVGIDSELLERVLEPFFTTKAHGKGTGMGLSMAYGFAKQSGGDLLIESEEGEGTRVSLILPVAKEDDKRVARQRTTAPADIGQLPSGDEYILVVEDNDFLRRWTAEQLEKLGYRVEQAENGRVALGKIKQKKKFDLVFSDIVMPGGISGLDLAEEIHDRFPQIGLLLTTGYADWNQDQYQLFAREGQVLRKPYAVEELATWIRAALEDRETQPQPVSK